MKSIVTSICLGLALIFTASARDEHQGQKSNAMTNVRRVNRASSTTAAAPATTMRRVTQPTTTQRNVSTTPFRQRAYTAIPRYNGNTTVHFENTTSARFRDRTVRANDQARVRSNVTINRGRNAGVNRESPPAVNREGNFQERNFRDRTYSANAGANVIINRNRNVRVTNNWRNGQFSGRQYAAFRNYHHTWHNRHWWRDHYTRIILVGGGWWYWDAGYWYPAWGYDPHAYYPYDGPIYGYSDLTPDQVVFEVQAQLQRNGYYAGAIDGVLGLMTRQAIADFQADNGLAITSTVDEPTLETLGIS